MNRIEAPAQRKPDLIPPTAKLPLTSVTKEVAQFLIEAASWATSGDNSQPWLFSWDGQILQVSIDPNRCGFSYDLNDESILIAIGAAIENIKIAASLYSLEAHWKIDQSYPASSRIAQLHFTPNRSVQPDELASEIKKRCVNRNIYKNKPIPRQLSDELAACVAVDGVNLHIFHGRCSNLGWANTIFKADRLIFEHQAMHQDLVKWTRGRKQGSCTDGMPIESLGLNPVEKLLFPIFLNWSLVKRLNLFGLSRITALKSWRWIMSSSALVVFTIKQNDPIQYLKLGGAVQRFWLKLTQKEIAAQPMCAWLFLVNHLRLTDANTFSARHQKVIKSIDRFSSSQLPNNEIPAMCLRIGLAAPPKGCTTRRKLEEFFQLTE